MANLKSSSPNSKIKIFYILDVLLRFEILVLRYHIYNLITKNAMIKPEKIIASVISTLKSIPS